MDDENAENYSRSRIPFAEIDVIIHSNPVNTCGVGRAAWACDRSGLTCSGFEEANAKAVSRNTAPIVRLQLRQRWRYWRLRRFFDLPRPAVSAEVSRVVGLNLRWDLKSHSRSRGGLEETSATDGTQKSSACINHNAHFLEARSHAFSMRSPEAYCRGHGPRGRIDRALRETSRRKWTARNTEKADWDSWW